MRTIKKIWVNGCFDVVHRGHIELFQYAKSLGTCLIVGIDTDNRVKKSKGDHRPYNNQDDRRYFLESIKYIDKVLLFNSDEELSCLIKDNNIDIMVVGSDWKGKHIVGSHNAGSVEYFDRIGEYSTTNILGDK